MPLPLTPAPSQDYLHQQLKICVSCRSAITEQPGIHSTCPECGADAPPTHSAPVNDTRSLCSERVDSHTCHSPSDALKPHSPLCDPAVEPRVNREASPDAETYAPLSELLAPPLNNCPSYEGIDDSSEHDTNDPPSPIIRHRDTAYLRSHEHSSPRHLDIAQRHSPSYHPLTDITRLRVPSEGYHCLYPGATFVGTQKSGRNSYEVSVTIVNVDMRRSFLCGYLRIRGLTDDWPELTTYFDAEIIGSRYGFLTQKWGSSEHQDTLHWSRFPAFRNVKNELKKPYLTMSDRDRGAVFMRWKEKFLVPDHRVQDVSGASFAGFYYVCVDFNPAGTEQASPASRSSGQSAQMSEDGMGITNNETLDSTTPRLVPSNSKTNPSDSTQRMSPQAPVATMQGFYYHANSEPYQQLSLRHVPEQQPRSSFEFR